MALIDHLLNLIKAHLSKVMLIMSCHRLMICNIFNRIWAVMT